MAVDLTTPDVSSVVYQDGIITIEMVMPHVWSEPDDKFKLDKPNLALRSSAQKFLKNVPEGPPRGFPDIPYDDMDPTVKAALKTVYEWVEAHAQTNGWLESGTGEEV